MGGGQYGNGRARRPRPVRRRLLHRGHGTRDEGPAGTAAGRPGHTVGHRPAHRQGRSGGVDAVQLVKRDPRVSERVRTDLKPCTGDEYPVDASYGTLTGGSSADVVVNVMTCGDAVGVGTYVYRARSDGTYQNVFTTSSRGLRQHRPG